MSLSSKVLVSDCKINFIVKLSFSPSFLSLYLSTRLNCLISAISKELIAFFISLYSKLFGVIILKSLFEAWNFEIFFAINITCKD